MHRLVSRLSTVASAGALVALAACGGSSGGAPANPKAELTEGVQGLADSDVLTTTIQLDTDPGSLQRIAAASGSSISHRAAQSISSSRVVVESKKADKSSDADVRVVVGGTTLLDVRGVAQSLYFQADVRAALALFNKSSTYGQLQAQAGQLPAFAQDVIAGKWVSISKDALTGLAGQLGASSNASGSANDNKVLSQLKGALQRDVTVTRAGSDSRGDHLVLTGDTRKLAQDAQQELSSAVPGGSALTDRLPTQSATSRKVKVDAWVKDGALTELSVNLAQFAPPSKVPAGTKLSLVALFARSGSDIAAPPNATPIDLTQLGGLFTGLSGGTSVSPSTGSATLAPATSG
jgi:hypothetical protein